MAAGTAAAAGMAEVGDSNIFDRGSRPESNKGQVLNKHSNIRQGPGFEKSPSDLLIRGSDNFSTMEPYLVGLKSLCDNFYYMN